MTFNADIAGIKRGLWLIKLACWIAGATLRTWKARRKRSGEIEVHEGKVKTA